MVTIAFPSTLTLVSLTISTSNSEAGCTRFGCVSGWNTNQFDSLFETFVSQKHTQLIERPTIGSTPFFSVAWFLIQVIPDASQIFYCYYLFVISSRFNDRSANRVVKPSLKSSLLARQPFQKLSTSAARTSRAFTSFILKILSQIGIVVAQFIYIIGIPIISRTCVCNRLSAQVNPQTLIRIICLWWLGFYLNLNVILSRLSFDQDGRSWCFSAQQMPLVITNQQRERIPSVFQCQFNRPVMFVKAKYSRIVSSASWFKFFDWTIFKLCTFAITRNPRNSLTDQVSWQLKCLFAIVVSLFMYSQSACNFWVNRRVDPVTAISKTLKRGINNERQSCFNPKLATNRKHLLCHAYSIFHICSFRQSVSGSAGFQGG